MKNTDERALFCLFQKLINQGRNSLWVWSRYIPLLSSTIVPSIKTKSLNKVDDFLDQWLILKYGVFAFSIVNLIDLLTTLIGLNIGLSQNNFSMYVLIELFKKLGFIILRVIMSAVILMPLILLNKKEDKHSKEALIGVGMISIIISFRLLIAVINNINLIVK